MKHDTSHLSSPIKPHTLSVKKYEATFEASKESLPFKVFVVKAVYVASMRGWATHMLCHLRYVCVNRLIFHVLIFNQLDLHDETSID